MRLTDAQVCRLVASDPSDTASRFELRSRVRQQIVRAIPSKTGRCTHGRPVSLDDKGAYSSGYWWHTDDGRVCEDAGAFVAEDPPTPHQARLRALLESLESPVTISRGRREF